jgi:hypothetical protein
LDLTVEGRETAGCSEVVLVWIGFFDLIKGLVVTKAETGFVVDLGVGRTVLAVGAFLTVEGFAVVFLAFEIVGGFSTALSTCSNASSNASRASTESSIRGLGFAGDREMIWSTKESSLFCLEAAGR